MTLAVCGLLLGLCVGCQPSEEEKIGARMIVSETPADQRVQLTADLANQIILAAHNAQSGKFEDQVLDVRGVVRATRSDAWTDEDGKSHHINELSLAMPEYAALKIVCIFDKGLADYVAGVSRGQEIHVTGRVYKVDEWSLTLIGCIPVEDERPLSTR